MKRTALKRKSPMERNPMRRVPRSTKYSRRERDFDRMGWIKTQPCAVAVSMVRGIPLGDVEIVEVSAMASAFLASGAILSCTGVVEAHHAGVRGLGQKADDDTCIALCKLHHDSITDRSGCFSGWPRGAVKEWELTAIAFYRRLYTPGAA